MSFFGSSVATPSLLLHGYCRYGRCARIRTWTVFRSLLGTQSIPAFASTLSGGSAAVNHGTKVETIDLHRGESHRLKLRIYRYSPTRLEATRVILYLPSAVRLSHEEEPSTALSHVAEEQIANVLSSSAQATVVYVDYNIGTGPGCSKFPNPIYDVLSAFDWVASHRKFLSGTNNSAAPAGTKQLNADESNEATVTTPTKASSSDFKIAICGQLLGGSLATMLGLTECRKKIKSISAVAVNNPITDWIFPDRQVTSENETPHKTKASKKSSWTTYADTSPFLAAEALYRTREDIFEKEHGYTDPFASPILFFRSSGLDYSHSYSPYRLHNASNSAPSSSSPSNSPPLSSPPPPSTEESPDTSLSPSTPTLGSISRRRASRTYPPSQSGLVLPPINITTGKTSILHDQAAELAKRYRKSVTRQNQSVAGSSRRKRTSAASDDDDDDDDHVGNDDDDGGNVTSPTGLPDAYASSGAYGLGPGLEAGLGSGAEVDTAGTAVSDAVRVAEAVAKDQVQYQVRPGVGIWGLNVEDEDAGRVKRMKDKGKSKSKVQGERWEVDVERVGRWIKDVLDEKR